MWQFTLGLLFAGAAVMTQTTLPSQHPMTETEREGLKQLTVVGPTGSVSHPGQSLMIKDSVVDISLDGAEAEFAPAIRFSNCTFLKDLNFVHATFKKSVSFDRCTFIGRCNFAKASFVDADFAGSKFDHGINLISVHTSGDLTLAQTRFPSSKPGFGVDLRGADIGGRLSVRLAECHGPADFSFTHVGVNFDATGSRFDYRPGADVGFDLGYARIAQTCDFRYVDLHSPHEQLAPGRGPRVPGHIDTELTCIVSFDGARIGRLELSGLQPAWDATQFRLDDLTYSSVAAPGPDYSQQVPWMEQMFLGRAELVPSAYSRYSAFLKDQGYPKLSDRVFLAEKARERLAARAHLNTFPQYLGGLVLYGAVRYGKEPAQAFLIGGGIVVVGMFIFWRKMEPPASPDSNGARKREQSYNPFWYSLDLFAPVIELGSAKEWIPSATPRWRWHYMRFHRILGWILVPIGVAALVGIVQ